MMQGERPGEADEVREMREYRCRRCGTFLFACDAGRGRLRARCPNRRCATVQLVFLGGYQPREADTAPESRMA
jgi:phage FluMu protein Com